MEHVAIELKPMLMFEQNGERQLSDMADMLAEIDLMRIEIEKNYSISGLQTYELSALKFGVGYSLGAIRKLLDGTMP